jgi:hypothetical protein
VSINYKLSGDFFEKNEAQVQDRCTLFLRVSSARKGGILHVVIVGIIITLDSSVGVAAILSKFFPPNFRNLPPSLHSSACILTLTPSDTTPDLTTKKRFSPVACA